MRSNVVKKNPPPSDVAPAAILGIVGNCRSTKGISTAVVDANAVIEGDQSLTNFADKFVTIPELLNLQKLLVICKLLSFVDINLIALTYTLEAQVHGTKNLRDVPPPIQTVSVKRLPEKELPGWGSNVANLEEWEALENETEENSNPNSKILHLKDLNMNIIPSDNCSEVGSVVSHTEHQEEDGQEGERKHRRYPPKKTEEGKMVVEGVDASQCQYDDEDSGDWTLAVSSSTRRKFLRRKAKWEHYNALAEQEIQQDQEADKARNMTVNTTTDVQKQSNKISKDVKASCAKYSGKNDEDLSSILKDISLEEVLQKALQEGHEETNVEATLINGEDDIDQEGIDVANQDLEVNMEMASEASSVADDGSSEQSWSLRSMSESSVACITGDYAMQNVILQMGLRLLAPGGKQIRQLNRWIWRCHACCTVTPEIRKGHASYTVTLDFCPTCGNGGTLHKVAVTISENGTTVAASNPRITLRGTKFSIPMPKGGRDAITKNMVLREDQLPRKYLHPKTKKKASNPGDEYFVSDDVFLNHQC